MEADMTENYQGKVENVYNSDESNDSASETEEKGQRILDLSYTGMQPGTFQIDDVSWNEDTLIYTLLSTTHRIKASKRKIGSIFS